MAAYCALSDLVERFGEDELLDLAADATGLAIDTAIVERACDDAAGEIDGRVAAAGYPVPLSPVPRIITAYACDIARYRLFEDRATDQVTKRYEDAIRFLRSVAKGEVKLGISTSSGSAEATSGSAEFQSDGRVFNGGGF